MPTKHAINSVWCLWLRNQYMQPSEDWNDSQIMCHKFGTVEDFWCLIKSIKNPFETNTSAEYSIFREGFKPDYNDKKFKQGGRIIIKLTGPENGDPKKLCKAWTHVLICLIGETLESIGGICCVGVRLVIKPTIVKIEIWTTKNDEGVIQPLAIAIATHVMKNVKVLDNTVKFGLFDRTKNLKYILPQIDPVDDENSRNDLSSDLESEV